MGGDFRPAYAIWMSPKGPVAQAVYIGPKVQVWDLFWPKCSFYLGARLSGKVNDGKKCLRVHRKHGKALLLLSVITQPLDTHHLCMCCAARSGLFG